MRILVHVCCGPCSATVLRHFKDAGCDVAALFYNPNIQPLAEYMRRREGAAQAAERLGVPLIFADTLPEAEQIPVDPLCDAESLSTQTRKDTRHPLPPAANPVFWLRAVSGNEQERCLFCWRLRLGFTAAAAARLGYDAFSSSLLYSRYQDHAAIRSLGEGFSQDTGVGFAYEDFRTTWQEGIALSKAWGIYRQQYCGCTFSEYERYAKDFARVRQQAEPAQNPTVAPSPQTPPAKN